MHRRPSNLCLLVSIRGVSQTSLENDSLPFKSWVLEIYDKTNTQARDFQVIQHLAEFAVRYFFYGFDVHNKLIKADQIRNIFANADLFVFNFKPRLLLKGDFLQTKLDYERILVWFLKQSMA